MQIRMTPKIGPRYWTAILIASMCGTNAGDFFPEVLKIGTGTGLFIQAGLFALIVLADRMTRRGSEAFYWLAILVVRAAATNIADFSIGQAHLSYVVVATALAVLLAFFLVARVGAAPGRATDELPPTNVYYWITMLTAGALGTVIGDGFGNSFSAVEVGVPISASVATVVLAMLLGARTGLSWRTASAYWITVVAVRWWGTNFGDTLAFFLSLTVSLMLTGAALTLVLLLWRAAPAGRNTGDPKAA